jgi:hypothetical protein
VILDCYVDWYTVVCRMHGYTVGVLRGRKCMTGSIAKQSHMHAHNLCLRHARH